MSIGNVFNPSVGLIKRTRRPVIAPPSANPTVESKITRQVWRRRTVVKACKRPVNNPNTSPNKPNRMPYCSIRSLVKLLYSAMKPISSMNTSNRRLVLAAKATPLPAASLPLRSVPMLFAATHPPITPVMAPPRVSMNRAISGTAKICRNVCSSSTRLKSQPASPRAPNR